MKKSFFAFLLVGIILFSAGCGRKASTVPLQTAKNEVTVEIDSEPEGAFVLVDRVERGITPCRCEVSEGIHTIDFLKESHYEVVIFYILGTVMHP